MLAIPVAQHGHAHIIHLLDEYGAEWEEIDPSRGGPALMHAANNGHSGAVTALLEVLLFISPACFAHAFPHMFFTCPAALPNAQFVQTHKKQRA